MKLFSLTLVALLLAAVWTESWGMSFRSSYTKCCYKKMFIKKEIPASFIRSYQETSPHCSHRAVIVELLKGKKLCVDPTERWFQQYLQRQKLSNALV
ncbi:C-C motif chemokine 3-like [Cygnus olor]|uniref:C-C motif chemokine 3-like n=1 Tax=Cygnus atratus TaxID=8868 RepID=UPI0015D5B0AE|nr:C-C motif chemokine 3-like [Cygnus atratus]XP_040388550.1 C-C motif chemokine 3-like [Cygnus olor]